MAKERHPVAFLVGAAIGGALGGVVGLLNAPRPGAETRARLTERWHDVEERTAQGLASLETEVRDRLGGDGTETGEAEFVSVTIDRPARG
jgi:gas vesicle protein